VLKRGLFMSSKIELVLEGLDCAHCAAKIENKVNELETVKSANLNFMTKTISIEVDPSSSKGSVVTLVKEIVNNYEPHVVVLEKEQKRVEPEASYEMKELYRLIIGGIVFVLPMIFDFPSIAEFLIFLCSYFIVGGEVLLTAIKNIIKGQIFDENFLMTLATIGAFAIGEYPEGVAVMLFYQAGEFLQDLAVNRSRKSIEELMDIRPDYANIMVDGEIRKVSPEEVKIGDIIVVKPGERVPLDGEVIEGISYLDTSALTGESVLREVKVGDEVLSGFINMKALLTVKVKKTFTDSTVSKILDLVENASSKKAPTENFITKFARYYTPTVVFIALGLALIPPVLIEGELFSKWIYRALVFLVISCPCALVISIPLGFFGGIRRASREGILIKGGNYLEALNSVETVVFDKTGTLTKGVFEVNEVVAQPGFTEEEVLLYGAYAEGYSNHPIAMSILKKYGKKINKEDIEEYQELPGRGIKAKIRGKIVLCGNHRLMEEENIPYKRVESIGTTIYVAIDNRYAGHMVISDKIKEDSLDSIKELKNLGIQNTAILTGDNEGVARKIGDILGVNRVYAELLPQDKVRVLEELDKSKSPKKKILFVGDGINDAPVLARADIGVAMGGLGSDAAIEAADIVLMTDEPTKLITAIKVAKHTKRIVWQNIVFSLGIKVAVMLLGAIGYATMWLAVFADVGVAFIAVLNSMRILGKNSL